MLGQESTSGSALGSVDSETITRYTADRCGFYHAPERAPVRVGLWVGRAGPRQWLRKTGTEIWGCLIVHSQNKDCRPAFGDMDRSASCWVPG